MSNIVVFAFIIIFSILFCIGGRPGILIVTVPTLVWYVKEVLLYNPKNKEKKEQKKLNKKAPKFRYDSDVFSVKNKAVNLGLIIIVILLMIAYFGLDAKSNNSEYVFVFIGVLYLGLIIFTLWREVKNKKKKITGVKCRGVIHSVLIIRTYNRTAAMNYGHEHGYSTHIHLDIVYVNPQTCETKHFITSSVNINPIYALSLLDVTVYEQKDGSVWATDFVQAKYDKDTLKAHGIELEVKHVDTIEKENVAMTV